MQELRVREFNSLLFRWHRTHYREMQWRNTRDPFFILVSELMLQQTQVARVKEKYAEFITMYPTVKKLAGAPLGDVLRIWSGLGYNRRAKFLHQCAKVIVQQYGSVFPDDYDELIQLPGIGRSTAGALLAFAFDKETPMIDTNIRRILARVFFKGEIVPSDKELYAFASQMIPKGKGSEWNYAMLDLGATQCTARNHAESCPMNALHGKVGDFQFKKPQKKFAGSNRFYRGQILQILTSKGNQRGTQISSQLAGYEGEITTLLDALLKDGLIMKERGYYKVPI